MSASAPVTQRPLLGVALRCVTATAFAIMAALLKIASDRGASVDDLIFYRSAGALPVVAGWALGQGGVAAVRTRHPIRHLTRGCIGFLAMILTFGALALLPIATATTLTYSAPIVATVLSALFLGEAVGPHRWLAVLVGFLGVALVAGPGGSGLSPLGIAAGLGASIGQACVAITLRQIGRSESPTATAFWFTMFTGLCSGLFLPWLGVRHDLGLTAILLGSGLVGGIGQLATTASVRFAPVSVVVPFDYLQILWATLIGWLVFASPPSPAMLSGAALIAAGGIYTAYREVRIGRIPTQAESVPEGYE